MAFSESQKSRILDRAREVIRATLAGAPIPPADTGDPELLAPAGCFVTLHDAASHRLRGCIGRLDASEPLMSCVTEMAQSVLDDPRFTANPVWSGELAQLDIEVSVLTPMVDAATPLSFDPKVHGIVLRLGGRSGVFLPQVAAETGWNREELLGHLCAGKMGLDPLAWKRPGAKLQTFTCEVIGPEPFELESTP